MSANLSCPRCSMRVRLPAELIGKRVKCPGCGASFVASPITERATAAGASGSRLPRPAWADYPHEEEPAAVYEADSPADDATGGVRLGLGLQGLAHLLQLTGTAFLAILLLYLATETPERMGPDTTRTFHVLLQFAVVLLFLLGWILGTLAGCLMASAPRRQAARGFALGYTVFSVLILLGLSGLFGASLRNLLEPGLHDSPTEYGYLSAFGVVPFEIARLSALGGALGGIAHAAGARRQGRSGFLLAALTPLLLVGVGAVYFVAAALFKPGPGLSTLLGLLNLGTYGLVLLLGLLSILGVRNTLRTVPGAGEQY